MNILVLTESGEHWKDSCPINFKSMEKSVFKDEHDKSQFEYCKYDSKSDNEVELYRSIDQNNPQVIFIDSYLTGDTDLKIAEKILEYYGRSCPDLVGFSAMPSHARNFKQHIKNINRDYDYVYSTPDALQDKQHDEQFFNYLRRKVIRYKSECGRQGLITRNGDEFLFNNEVKINLSPNEKRFLTILFDNVIDGQKCATWKIFCDEFENGREVECNKISSRSDNLKLNDKLKDIKYNLLKKLSKGLKGEMDGDLISSSGVGEKAIWCYENKIKLSKIDISND